MPIETVSALAARWGEIPRKMAVKMGADADQVIQAAAQDQRLHADELALIKQLTKGQSSSEVAALLSKNAKLKPEAAQQVTSLLQMSDEHFKHKLAVDKSRPVILKLVDGQIDPKSQLDLQRPFSAEDLLSRHEIKRLPVTVTEVRKGMFNFRFTGSHPATYGTLTVGNVKVPFVAPLNAPANLPKPEEVAKSLALLPEHDLKLIDKVVLNPVPHKKDQKVQDSISVTAMAGMGDITYFPIPWKQHQDDLDGTTLHEIGHLVHQHDHRLTQTPGFDWEMAIHQDGQGVSQYGDTSRSEDFAETFSMYLLGGKDDPKLRARFPNRFALLDKMIG